MNAEPLEQQPEEETFDDLIEESLRLKRVIKGLNESLKFHDNQLKEVEYKLLNKMKEQGIRTTGNDFANVTYVSKELPNVEDWDAFYDYIYQNNAGYLLQRRPSAKALEELVRLEGDVPGITFFTKESVSIRARNK